MGLVAALLIVITPQGVETTVISGLLMLVLAMATKKQGTVLHPAVLLGLGLALFGLLGYTIYPHVRENGPIPHIYRFTAEEWRSAYYLVAIFAATCALVAILMPSARSTATGRQGLGDLPPLARAGMLAAALLTSLALLAGADLSAMWSRDGYQDFYGEFVEAFRVGSALSLAAGLSAFVILQHQSSSLLEKITAGVAISVLVFVAAATSSRELALIPILYVLACWLAKGRFPSVAVLVLVGTLVLASFSAVIHWRESGEHGLSSYINQAVQSPWEVSTGQLPRMIANTLDGYPNAAFTSSERALPLSSSDFLLALNPLPGESLGYYEYYRDYRVFRYIPYGTVGMLGRIGAVYGVLFYAALGIGLSALWRAAHKNPVRAAIGRPILVGGTLLIFLMSMQYALRSTARIATILLIALPLTFLVLRANESAVDEESKQRLPAPSSRAP
ncbi:hypothetical protein FTX61_04285 [Nitriliruptoraceae bacterium ZYF776]|nr:hypothetical protein [Profundirhabdus halotolerans]